MLLFIQGCSVTFWDLCSLCSWEKRRCILMTACSELLHQNDGNGRRRRACMSRRARNLQSVNWNWWYLLRDDSQEHRWDVWVFVSELNPAQMGSDVWCLLKSIKFKINSGISPSHKVIRSLILRLFPFLFFFFSLICHIKSTNEDHTSTTHISRKLIWKYDEIFTLIMVKCLS